MLKTDKTDFNKVSFFIWFNVRIWFRSGCMQFNDVILKRRSTRKFSHEKIETEKIFELIESARWSPSAANRQNWYFVVVENKMKDKIAQIMEEELKSRKQDIKDIETPTKPYTAAKSLIGSIQVIREAPILILAFRNPDQGWLEGDYLSMGSAIEHISLKATDLGLGSLWIRDIVYTRDEIAEVLNLSHMELVASIAVGYSKEYPYPRKKKELNEIMRIVS